jgi:hypothetical protein
MAPTKRSTKSDTNPTPAAEETPKDVNTTAASEMGNAANRVAESEGSRLPCAIQFPLTIALSFTLSALGSMIISQASKGELESKMRTADTGEEIAVLAGWKM